MSFSAVERINGTTASGVLLLCDHAANALPDDYRGLGLPVEAFKRHIAYDIGAAAMTARLAAGLGAPALLATFSRLLIDPNRGDDDPTLIMRLSDGAVIPGNARIDAAERQRRIADFWRPYHDAIETELAGFRTAGIVPLILSIHSFTPIWKALARPWQIGILWDADPRLARRLIEGFGARGDLVVGDNLPYDGALKNDTLYSHASRRGIAHGLIEYRQDLIAADAGQTAFAARTLDLLGPILADPALRRIEHHGSRTGPVEPIDDFRQMEAARQPL